MTTPSGSKEERADPTSASVAPPPSSSADTRESLIDVRKLSKTFHVGLFVRKKVEAVKDVTFQVRRGEIFGFLGPNGAGKTTTIKVLTGLIAPSGGEARLFGEPVSSPRARRRVGFLPENPYVYPYLTPREFVHLCGRLSGMRGRTLASRADDVLKKVGIAYAADRQVRRLSKGMLQRAGLAAALVADPEMLILDEPMSGLDPVGRKEVRDLIFEERAQGRTIFFSTHILGDVEAMCDRVAILREGKVVVSGAIRQLLRGDVLRTEIVLGNAAAASVSSSPNQAESGGPYRAKVAELRARLEQMGAKVHERPDVLVAEVEGEAKVAHVLRAALDADVQVLQVTPRRETLEDLFLRRAL